MGLGSLGVPWLGDPSTALWVVVLVSAWQWVGFPVLLYGAALGGVPEELSEAARVDGAGHWQTFRSITFPLLVPAIGTVSVLTFIFAMEAFALPYALGGSTGNPAGWDEDGGGVHNAFATQAWVGVEGAVMACSHSGAKSF